MTETQTTIKFGIKTAKCTGRMLKYVKGEGGQGGDLFVETLACELVVEVDYQRVVPPVKA